MIAPDVGVGLDLREAARRSWPAQYTPEFIAANSDFLEAVLERVGVHPTPVGDADPGGWRRSGPGRQP